MLKYDGVLSQDIWYNEEDQEKCYGRQLPDTFSRHQCEKNCAGCILDGELAQYQCRLADPAATLLLRTHRANQLAMNYYRSFGPPVRFAVAIKLCQRQC